MQLAEGAYGPSEETYLGEAGEEPKKEARKTGDRYEIVFGTGADHVCETGGGHMQVRYPCDSD